MVVVSVSFFTFAGKAELSVVMVVCSVVTLATPAASVELVVVEATVFSSLGVPVALAEPYVLVVVVDVVVVEPSGLTVVVEPSSTVVVDTAGLSVPSAFMVPVGRVVVVLAVSLVDPSGFDFVVDVCVVVDVGENFNYPYVSTSIREFWRRWHISLSTWFRDYLYIPLGGNRKGKARAALNRIIVFFLCGLWHGASWTFVFWGLYHGAFLLLEQYVPFFNKNGGTGKDASRARRAFGHVYLVIVVLIGWVFFRADTIGQGFTWVATMFAGWTFEPVQMALVMSLLTPLNLTVFAVGCVTCLPVLDRLRGRAAFERASWAVTVVLLALCLLSLATGTYNPFIYFRF